MNQMTIASQTNDDPSTDDCTSSSSNSEGRGLLMLILHKY